jgi:hypothetical protein
VKFEGAILGSAGLFRCRPPETRRDSRIEFLGGHDRESERKLKTQVTGEFRQRRVFDCRLQRRRVAPRSRTAPRDGDNWGKPVSRPIGEHCNGATGHREGSESMDERSSVQPACPATRPVQISGATSAFRTPGSMVAVTPGVPWEPEPAWNARARAAALTRYPWCVTRFHPSRTASLMCSQALVPRCSY